MFRGQTGEMQQFGSLLAKDEGAYAPLFGNSHRGGGVLFILLVSALAGAGAVLAASASGGSLAAMLLSAPVGASVGALVAGAILAYRRRRAGARHGARSTARR